MTKVEAIGLFIPFAGCVIIGLCWVWLFITGRI